MKPGDYKWYLKSYFIIAFSQGVNFSLAAIWNMAKITNNFNDMIESKQRIFESSALNVQCPL